MQTDCRQPFLFLQTTVGVSIGSHMISSATWDKSARVIFSKTNQIARVRRATAICTVFNSLRVLTYPK